MLGYSHLYELTSDPEIQVVVRDVLGNSVEDALRSNWNWDLGDRVSYRAYDWNHVGDPVTLTYRKDEAKPEHPDLGKRDPSVLHPY